VGLKTDKNGEIMRIWYKYESADIAVKTIKKLLEETGTIPETLLKAYNKTLQTSYRGVVQRFYEKLAEECPQALKYFPGNVGEEKKEL